MLDTNTGELMEITLTHEGNNVREFYSKLPRPVRVGIEATGSMQWFVNLMEELGIECLVGHPAEIRAAEPRKQKHDRRDADLILKLLMEDRFPAIWLPSKELQDLRSLLRHRHQWVRMRTRIQNALQSIALANGLRRGPSLWSQAGQHTIASLPLAPHSAYRRSELQALYVKFEAEIEKLNQRVEEQACGRPGARLLMTHPGVGPVTALATEVFLGDPARFADSKALASYGGLIPREYSSGGRQRLGGLTKQGNPLLRFLWGEAGAHAVRRDPELQRFYRRKLIQKASGRRAWPWLANSGSDCGSCCGIRLSTTSSVVVDRSSRRAVMPVRGCQKRGMVRTVIGRLIRLPASLEEEGVRITHHGQW
jgi:transposase